MTDRAAGRTVALLVAAGLVAAATVAAVVLVGVARPPAVGLLGVEERPDRSLAVVTYRDRGQCLDVVEPDGTVREVRCGLDGLGMLVSFDERGITLERYDRFGASLETLDARTGEVVMRERADPPSRPEIPISTGWVSSDFAAGILTVRDEDGRILWSVAAPESYGITSSARDPQTGSVALLDTARRLLLLAPGATAPKVWVEDLGAAYGEMVWQGGEGPAQ